MPPLLFTGKNHSSRDCRKQKITGQRYCNDSRRRCFLEKQGRRKHLKEREYIQYEWIFICLFHEQTSPDQVCSALLFGFTPKPNCRQSNLIQNIQRQKSTIARRMAKMSLVQCMWLNFDVDRNNFGWGDIQGWVWLTDSLIWWEGAIFFWGEVCSCSLIILSDQGQNNYLWSPQQSIILQDNGLQEGLSKSSLQLTR